MHTPSPLAAILDRLSPPSLPPLAGLSHQLRSWASRLLRAQPAAHVTPEDLAQETLCRLLTHYGETWLETRPPSLLKAVAWRSLKNLLVDERRRHRSRLDEDAVAAAVDEAPDPEQRLLETIGAERLELALATLPPIERAFLVEVMRRDSVPAAQRLVGWPRASPYYHLARLLGLLRAELGGLTRPEPTPMVPVVAEPSPPRIERPPHPRGQEHHRRPSRGRTSDLQRPHTPTR